jgi:hypothetical protein
MKRSELYEKVWQMPMTRLAKELGVSDVGLAKACRRNAIPTPPRGYWAKLEAGKAVDKPALPRPESNSEVDLVGVDPKLKASQQAARAKEEAWLLENPATVRDAGDVKILTSLDTAHALVKATAQLCERIPALVKRWERRRPGDFSSWKDEDRPPHVDQGRHRIFRKGCLNITADLTHIEWILRFHATLLAQLERRGFKIAWREATTSRHSRQGEDAAVIATRNSEAFELQFSEGYRRLPLSAADIAAYKKRHGHSRNETVPSGKYSLHFLGTEYRARKSWQFPAEGLEKRLGEIVLAMDELATLQPLYRREREEAAAKAQREQERRENERRTRESRADQLKRAFAMADAQERTERLRAFIISMEARCAGFRPPFAERARVWLSVVRDELESSDPVEAMLGESLSVPSWGSWPPSWWPEGVPSGVNPSEEDDPLSC